MYDQPKMLGSSFPTMITRRKKVMGHRLVGHPSHVTEVFHGIRSAARVLKEQRVSNDGKERDENDEIQSDDGDFDRSDMDLSDDLVEVRASSNEILLTQAVLDEQVSAAVHRSFSTAKIRVEDDSNTKKQHDVLFRRWQWFQRCMGESDSSWHFYYKTDRFDKVCGFFCECV